MPRTIALQQIHIETPCTADWSAMRGDDSHRHCERCELSVINVSQLTRRQAEKLFREQTGRLCVRIERRGDGSIITHQRRPLRHARRWIARAAAVTVAILVSRLGGERANASPVGSTVRRWMAKAVAAGDGVIATATTGKPIVGEAAMVGTMPAPPTVMMGDVVIRPPATQATTQPTGGNATTQPAVLGRVLRPAVEMGGAKANVNQD